jgi:hypothetical protein
MRTGIRKTMKVATTFTGVAACAAAFAPAATAATTGHQLPYKNAPVTAPHGVRPGISERGGCPGGTSNWFHVGYAKVQDTCFGFKGTFSGSPVYYATSFCGGNNTGWIAGYLDGGAGAHYFTYFGHGTTYAHIPGTSASEPLAITQVHISGWSGGDKCGFP